MARYPAHSAKSSFSTVALRTLSPSEIVEHAEAFLAIAADVSGEYWNAENFLRDLPDKWRLSFAAWDGASPVGYAVLSRKTPTHVHLHHFMIAAAYRGAGLGAQMVDEMVERARSSGARSLTLKVNDPRAASFYRRNNFQDVGKEGEYLVLERELAPGASKRRLVAAHQPNYAPWLGYFHKIARADVFVFLDDVQFSKGSYTNRVQIGRDGGAAWLTEPVRQALGQVINDVGFAQDDWPARHLDALRGAYRQAARFDEIWPDLVSLYDRMPTENLAATNRYLIEAIVERLALDCRFVASSGLHLNGIEGDDRLIAIVEALAPGSAYLSGGGGDKYQDPAKFAAAGIDLIYTNFDHPVYPQGAEGFVPGLSVLDSVCHLGWAGARALLDTV